MAPVLSLLPHYSFLQMPLDPDTLEHSSSQTHPPTLPQFSNLCLSSTLSQDHGPLVSPVTILLWRRPWSIQLLRFKCESRFHHLLAERP